MLRRRHRLGLPLLVVAFPLALIAVAGISTVIAPPCSFAGTIASRGGWVRTGATLDPTYTGGAYQQYYNGGLSYAELGATPGFPNYVQGLIAKALGIEGGRYGLPGGFALLVRAVGSNSAGIRILKSDIGSGQPGDPHYTVDLHPRIAQLLHFDGKQDIEVKAAGEDPGVNPDSVALAGAGEAPGTCDQLTGDPAVSLVSGERARILSDGSAAAPADAPPAVKRAIAAANRIHTTYYQALRPEYLDRLYPWYDCSASTAYVLYNAGLDGTGVTVGGTDAGNGITLEAYGDPGPGRWISVYGNSTHAFIVIAGLAFDTADFGGPNIPAGTGPRWRQNPTGNLQDGLTYTVRHPPGL